MHNLENGIALWRSRMSALLSEGAVRELEEHLREHIDVKRRGGMNPDAAFAEAVALIGEPQAIARDFGRLAVPWIPASWPIRAVLLMLSGWIAFMIVLVIAAHYSKKTMTPLLAAHVFTITAGYASAIAAGALGMYGQLVELKRQLSVRERGDLRAWIRRLTVLNVVILPIGIGLGMVWASENLGRAWGWDPKEVGALVILVSTFLQFVTHRYARGSERLPWVLAWLGSIALAIGWFGSAAISSPLPIACLGMTIVVCQVTTILNQVRAPSLA